jgi:predicted MFS family arabinose efflux permease
VPIALVLGIGEGLFLPGSFAVIPALLPDDELQAGNALASAGTQLATLAGPVLGGALVAFLGPAPAFAVDAATFAVSALTLLGVRSVMAPAARPAALDQSQPAASAEPRGPEHEVAPAREVPAQEGPAAPPTLRKMLRSERVLQVILLVSITANLGSGGMGEVSLPALAHGPLHAGAGGYGALIAAFAAGALLGTLVAGQVRRLRRPAMLASGVFLAQALVMAVIPYTGSTVAAGAALVAFGVANGFSNVIMITAFQRWAPPAALGRLTGLLMLTSFGVFPLSVAVAALVTRDLGPAPFFVLGAAALAVAIIAGLTQRDWRDFGASSEPAIPAVPGVLPAPAGPPAPGDLPACTAPEPGFVATSGIRPEQADPAPRT